MKLGERIQKLRREKGYSQEELAKLLGIGRSTLANYEQCKREPSYDTVEKISLILGTNPAFLFGWTDNNGEIIGLQKSDPLIIHLDFDKKINFVKMDKFQLYSSGIFDTFKDNQKQYYKWHNEITSKLKDYIFKIEESIEFYNELFIPFYNLYKEYFIPLTKEYVDNLESVLWDLEELDKYLDDMLYNQNNEFKIPTINTVEEKREYLSHYKSSYDFSNCSDKEIEEYFDKFIFLDMQENEKFKKAIGIDDDQMNRSKQTKDEDDTE